MRRKRLTRKNVADAFFNDPEAFVKAFSTDPMNLASAVRASYFESVNPALERDENAETIDYAFESVDPTRE